MLLGVGLEWMLNRYLPLAVFPSRVDSPVGYFFIVVSIALAVSSLAIFFKRRTTVVPHGEPAALVVRGPFRISRNPMYLGLFCLLVGIACLLGSLSPFLVPPVFVVTISSIFIPMEESNLSVKFGEEYRTYQTKVRRWI